MKKNFNARHKVNIAGDVIIFCDLDGVLSDFDAHAKAEGKLDDKGQPKWDALDYAWWSSMPAYDGMKDFYQTLRGMAHTRMLTAPVLNSGCHGGKAAWVVTHLGKFGLSDLVICPAKDKQLLAGPRRILVDDRQKNIDEWTAGGGIGILHTGDYAETLARVTQAVAALQKTPATPAPAPRAPE